MPNKTEIEVAHNEEENRQIALQSSVNKWLWIPRHQTLSNLLQASYKAC